MKKRKKYMISQETVADSGTTIINLNNPFSQERLNEIFKISVSNPDRIISRESSILEFKESFGWKSLPKYLKTCAAFANTKGGYLVFGIGRKPHKLLGLSGPRLKAFEDIEPEKLSGYLNDYFAPEIKWDIHEYELNGKIYGILYVYESKNKPVVCKKDADNVLKEGDIYYRYRGRSERIKYPELMSILDEKRKNEQALWMQHIEKIAKIGVNEVGIFDFSTGKVSGSAGSFVIDESLLSQLAFIKEGEFSEVKGKPTIKIIGEAKVIDGSIGTVKRKIIKTKGIRLPDIVLAFLKQEEVAEPIEYIKQICFETTGFLPVYYFIQLSGLTKDHIIEEINSVVSRSPAKKKLLERLKGNTNQSLPKPGSKSEVAIKKFSYMEMLKQHNVNQEIYGKNLEYCLQAIRMLTVSEIKKHSKYLRELLRIWFNKYYSSSTGTTADNLRRAICWIDEAMYGVKQ